MTEDKGVTGALKWAEPSDDEVSRAVVRIADPHRRGAFFAALENPLWVAPLRKRGFFKYAPSPEPAEDGMVKVIDWPEGGYLARAAREAPDEVTDALVELDAHGNPFANRSLVEAAANVPGGHAARLVQKIVVILSDLRRDFVDPSHLLQLLTGLLEAGEIKQADRLADAMYCPRPVLGDEVTGGMTREVVTGLDSYRFGETLPRAMDILVAKKGLQALRTAARWLRTWQVITGYATSSESDMSFIWRPSIAPHIQNQGFQLGDPLVEAVRDFSDRLIREGHAPMDVVSVLDREHQPVFARLALHLLASLVIEDPGGLVQEIATSRLLDPVNLDIALRHEYAELGRAVLPNASDEIVVNWEEMIRHDYVNDEDANRRAIAGESRDPTEVTGEEIEARRHIYQREMIASLGDSLPDRLSAWRSRLDSELGERDGAPADLPFSMGRGFVGPTSPLSAEEATSMETDDLLVYLSTWRPEPASWPPGPSREGFGQILTNIVREDPAPWAERAGKMLDLDPAYVQAALRGWELALRDGRGFRWEYVLRVVEEVSHRPDEMGDGGQDGDYFAHGGWRWVHQQAAIFLRIALTTSVELRPPISCRHMVWKATENLTNSPHPSSEDEAYLGVQVNPGSVSLNTTRGQAIRVIRPYLAWLATNNRKGSSGALTDDAVEAFDALEIHLDPGKDPSLSVRNVYGEEFPYLLQLAPHWAERNAAAIFGPVLAERDEQLADIAWNAYIAMFDPSPPLYQALSRQYAARVSRLSDVVDSSDLRSHAALPVRLGLHILLLYLFGSIDLHSDDALA